MGKEAQSAFYNLSYSKFKHLPLFLEWAPINLFNNNAATLIIKKKENEKLVKRKTRKKKRKLNETEEDKTKVIAKNIWCLWSCQITEIAEKIWWRTSRFLFY